jgi:PIN domain nuclease of toxin-antitoxin system
MTSIVLDASAVLALIFVETGSDAVAARFPHCMISAVNYTEILTKSVDRGRTLADTIAQVRRLQLSVWPLDAEQAATAASLRIATRDHDVSLADRCCLALALTQNVPVLTGDRKWRNFDVGVVVELFR